MEMAEGGGGDDEGVGVVETSGGGGGDDRGDGSGAVLQCWRRRAVVARVEWVRMDKVGVGWGGWGLCGVPGLGAGVC